MKKAFTTFIIVKIPDKIMGNKNKNIYKNKPQIHSFSLLISNSLNSLLWDQSL